MSTVSTSSYSKPTSSTRFFIVSAIWAAVIIPLSWLSSTFLSIPGAFGAGYFWLPNLVMPFGAYFFGPWGWLAAAVGTFFGGMLSGNPFLINIAQNPIPAFLGNTLLFWVFLKAFRVHVGEGVVERKTRSIKSIILVALVTVVLALVIGFFIGKATAALNISSNWGYLAIFLIIIPAWFVLGMPLNRHTIIAVLAVIVTSVVSAAMGAYAWATIGEMGATAWALVFPGWAFGDIVAGILAVPLMWNLNNEMNKRNLTWNSHN